MINRITNTSNRTIQILFLPPTKKGSKIRLSTIQNANPSEVCGNKILDGRKGMI